ncbi:hypothetical protein GN244_ATG08828 [Phytophthora infestans]|nr:hypothetical protein GN244_ATG08828 [Phytophthora infestans]
MVKEVVASYVDSIMDQTTSVESTRIRVCFRMARDLALFQNDFYIDELLKVCDTSFKWKYNKDKDDVQMNLELFLEQLVDSHPAYRTYSLRQSNTAPLCALDWLAQRHLRPHIEQRKRARICPIKSKTFWIWESMPRDMDVALEKLIPAIRKYMRVLGQFFLRQAVQTSSKTNKPRDYRMSSNSFISLMKQVRVFPQLFHRRELEQAVRLSCCSSPETEEINFPEFIETLMRCSCDLRWGELDGSANSRENNGDTVVVIKFVILIFAMEGQGSVLKKRNEDVSAILGFLGQQHKKKQTEKLDRFRKMLADNKRRSRASRKDQVPSVWNEVRLHFSPLSSPTRSPARSLGTFDELTESWDGGSPRRATAGPLVFDAQTNEAFDVDLPLSLADAKSYQSGLHSLPNMVDRTASDVVRARLCSQLSDKARSSMLEAGISGGASCHTLTDTEPALHVEEVPTSKEYKTSTTNHQEGTDNSKDPSSVEAAAHVDEAVDCDQVHQFTTPPLSTGLVEPMERDDFLRDIMDSIGDVELILSQPRFPDGNNSKFGRKQPPRTPLGYWTRDMFHADSMGCGPSLGELAADSHLHEWQHQISDIYSPEASEVQVHDAMLNHLTDINRFTESSGALEHINFLGSAPDNTSLIAIAGMAELPFTSAQDHPALRASQETRPAEEAATPPQPSTHELDILENTIK